MGKKSPPPKPPDLTPLSDAQIKIAKEANEISREQMGISREQFAWFQSNAREELELARTQADRLFQQQERAYSSDEDARKFAREVGTTQMDAMNLQMDYAKRDRARYEGVAIPMQDRMISEANAYDTPERREAEAARQMVDVQRQADAQRANADMRLRSMGIDPSQVRSSSMMNQMAVATAANQAQVGNAGRTMIEDKGRALRADAINMTAGLPAQAAMGFQGAGAAGQGATSAAASGQAATLGAIQGGAGVAGTAMGFRSGALNNVAALTGSPMQWAQMSGQQAQSAMSGYSSAANTMNQNYQMQHQQWKAKQEQAQQAFNNVMSVASVAGGMMMSEGGHVSRMSAGGVAAAAKGAMKGKGKGAMKIDRVTLDMPKTALDINNVGFERTPVLRDINTAPSLRERIAAKRNENDMYTRQGQGSGADGQLTWDDRMRNGSTAGAQYQNTNVYADMPGYEGMPNMMPVPQVMNFSEGGTPRAIPVRQSRDRIPALLTEGEYVVPRDVVQALGINHFDKLVKKYHRENS